MDRPVALKVIRGDLLGNAAMVERFRREVKAAARLASHPNIVAAYDAEQAGETHMLVMEFVEGTDLAELVERRGPLPVGEACEYARQAALGLQHAFEDGMVHRDIKPQNLMRTTRGQVKILDFGLARFASEVATQAGMTAEGMVLGSADYIAPEQIDDPHAADIRADIYSLGCTLYFLLAGRPPFPDGSLIQKLLAHSEKTPRPLAEIRADVPPELARVVERMMAKDPAPAVPDAGRGGPALAPFADAQAAAAPRSVDRGSVDTRPPVAESLTTAARRLRGRSPRRARVRASGATGQLGPIAPRRIWLPIAAALAMLAVGRRVSGPGHLPHPTDNRGARHRDRRPQHRGDRQARGQAGHDRRPEDQTPHRAKVGQLRAATGRRQRGTEALDRFLHAQARRQDGRHRAARARVRRHRRSSRHRTSWPAPEPRRSARSAVPEPARLCRAGIPAPRRPTRPLSPPAAI